jgi:hypothetical protein
MTVQEAARLSDVWREVESWPVKARLSLASRILHSVEQTIEDSRTSKKERHDALMDLIGIWRTEHPPSDEEVERILDEERQKKYG